MNGINNLQHESQDYSSGQASMLINGMIDNCIDQIESSMDTEENKEGNSIGEQLEFINNLQNQITSDTGYGDDLNRDQCQESHSHENCK